MHEELALRTPILLVLFRIQVTVTGLSLDRIIGTPWRALYISRFTLKSATPLLFTLLHMFIRCDHLMFSKYFF